MLPGSGTAVSGVEPYKRHGRKGWHGRGRTLTSSGKCQEYHSRTRMTKVLMSLSRVSSSAIAWITMLSTLFTLNFTCAQTPKIHAETPI